MFKDRLKMLRKQAGLSQQKFAKEINSAQTTIAGWESGAREPGFEMVKIIADYFHVTTDYILGRTEFPFDDSKPLIDASTSKPLEVVRGEDGLYKVNEQKKEAPAELSAEALQRIAEEEAGRPLTEAEQVLLRTRLEDLKATLDQITKKKD